MFNSLKNPYKSDADTVLKFLNMGVNTRNGLKQSSDLGHKNVFRNFNDEIDFFYNQWFC